MLHTIAVACRDLVPLRDNSLHTSGPSLWFRYQSKVSFNINSFECPPPIWMPGGCPRNVAPWYHISARHCTILICSESTLKCMTSFIIWSENSHIFKTGLRYFKLLLNVCVNPSKFIISKFIINCAKQLPCFLILFLHASQIFETPLKCII